MAYTAYRNLLRTAWRLRGGRTINIFGTSVTVHPETDFPAYRRYQLPTHASTEHIVQYADFVQMMAIARCLSEIQYSPTIVEVGAYEGAYAVILGKLAAVKRGRVLAIEPHSGSFRRLLWNVSLNGLDSTVTCIQTAVGGTSGTTQLVLDGSQSGISGIAPWQEGCSSEETRIEPLSVLLKEHGIDKVDVLLIDVEGAEMPVLKSLPGDTVPVGHIFCEFHPYAWPSFGYTKADLFNFLKEKNLRAMDMYFRELGPLIDDRYIGPTILIRHE